MGRESITPTDWPLIYTSADGQGTGTFAMNGARQLRITTGATIADNSNVRTSQLTFNRATDATVRSWSKIILDISWAMGTTGDTECFIGFINQFSSLTALPTTGKHIGIFVNQSTSDNWFLSSGNGVAQATTDTGDAIGAPARRLRVIWTGDDTATIEFYTSVTGGAPATTQTVTALLMGALAFEVVFFMETEAGAAKNINIRKWGVSFK